VVVYTDGRELARQTVTVVHTPWYHETYYLINQPVALRKNEIGDRIKLLELLTFIRKSHIIFFDK